MAWPSVLSLFSVSTMTLVDTLFIGRLGSLQLAAAGLGGVCVFAVLSFGLAIFGAAKVKVGELHGAKDELQLRSSLAAFLKLALLLGVLSAIVGVLAALSLPFLSSDLASGQLAAEYASIRSLAFPFALISAAIAQWRQAQGDSATGMQAAIFANLANLPLNALLIFGLHWGIYGAALATVFARLLECIWLLLSQLSRKKQQHTGIVRGYFWSQAQLRDSFYYFRVGLPTGVERVLDMIAFAAVPIILSQVGPLHVAAHQVVLQLMLFSFLPLIAFDEALSVLLSQAIGAADKTLCKPLVRAGLSISLAYAAVVGLLAIFARQLLVGLFTDDSDLILLGASTLLFGALLQFINAGYNLMKGVLRGFSQFHYVAYTTIACAWIITPPFTYVLGVRAGLGAPGAWLTLSIEVSIGLLILWRRVRQLLKPL